MTGKTNEQIEVDEKNEELMVTFARGKIKGKIPIGCQMCMRGMKMVYFMGGDCNKPKKCSWYCPISNNRKTGDIHYADELEIKETDNLKKVLEKLEYEARKIDAKGMSITGGDPLSSSRKVNWTVSIISGMKIIMGDDFHIHLYTCGNTFSEDIAIKLSRAGLDAIRFHPDEEDFNKIVFAIGKGYTVGAEVPVIPTLENHQYLIHLADYLENIGADYLNLNEFEMVSTNQLALQEKGFLLKDGSIAAVQGSSEYFFKFYEEFGKNSTLDIHYCTSSLKDGIQLRNRYIRRANTIKRDLEEVTEDGTLIFLRVSGSIKKIRKLKSDLINISGVPKKMLQLDPQRGRLDLPRFLSEDDDFINMISDYEVKAGVLEILPFREDEGVYREVEYTPISLS